ncbi:hypothetical protein PFLUV_G00227220 [Perca fluviatilis]|uniref:Reverse transcriptase domain-containing protein n=1 Tax=Perca fluviatilis TaxID=8168 RepID=A0A6A5E0R6_PERFL|nr:hypothetical protein PFLUV_G00227220 [Perca fluviatilis]
MKSSPAPDIHLRFAYQVRHWQFRVLPFGFSLSPRVFTRCMAAALAPLQSSGHEDPAVPGRLADLRDHEAKLGLKVNLDLSCLNPSQTTTFIGVALDTTTMRARLSPLHVENIIHLLALFQMGG